MINANIDSALFIALQRQCVTELIVCELHLMDTMFLVFIFPCFTIRILTNSECEGHLFLCFQKFSIKKKYIARNKTIYMQSGIKLHDMRKTCIVRYW